jgi:hypothetical protein
MQVKYAVMPTSDIGKLGTYKDLDVLVDTHSDTQFTPKLDADQIQIPPQRVLVISGGYKSIKYAFAQFNSKRIGLLVTNHTGPATIQLQIGYKKI